MPSGRTNAVMVRRAVALAMMLAGADLAHAHGIAGNRYFVGTMTFDDPAVADEAIIPYYSYPPNRHRAATSLKTGSTGFSIVW